jgi:hypothetical protein
VAVRRASVIGVIAGLGVAAAGGSAAAAPGDSGIAGRIVAGPTCPVERVPPDPQCAPRPLAASLRIHPAGKRGPVETTRSAANGRFSIRLAPGAYVVTPLARRGSPFPRPPRPSQVTVRAGRFTRVTITYDTGIR